MAKSIWASIATLQTTPSPPPQNLISADPRRARSRFVTISTSLVPARIPGRGIGDDNDVRPAAGFGGARAIGRMNDHRTRSMPCDAQALPTDKTFGRLRVLGSEKLLGPR